MKSKKKIFFSLVFDFSENSWLSAALAADKCDEFYLIAYDSDVLNQYETYDRESKKFIKREISADIFSGVISDFIHQLLGVDDGEIYEWNLETYNSSPRYDLKSIINEMSGLQSIEQWCDDEISVFLKNKNSSIYLIDYFIKVKRLVINIKKEIDSFYCGDSLLDKADNLKKEYSTDLQCLQLLELKTLVKKIEVYKKTEVKHFNKLLIDKIRNIKDFFTIVPSRPDDINIINGRNIYNHDSFPSVYKFISAMQFEFALRTLDKNISNLSFLHLIRSLDTYLEGYLIYSQLASIGDYVSHKSNEVYKDTFLMNGRQVLGITGKFEALNCKGLIENRDYQNIKKMIRIRNKLSLTHGDVKVCEDICKDYISMVKSVIISLEPKNQIGGFEWSKVRYRIHDLLTFHAVEVIYDSINENFIVAR